MLLYKDLNFFKLFGISLIKLQYCLFILFSVDVMRIFPDYQNLIYNLIVQVYNYSNYKYCENLYIRLITFMYIFFKLKLLVNSKCFK